MFPVDAHHRRLPALDLLAPGPFQSRAHDGVAWTAPAFRRRRGLDRSREGERKHVAPSTPPVPASVLLCRVWHRPTRSLAGLAQLEARQERGTRGLSEGARPGRLASAA